MPNAKQTKGGDQLKTPDRAVTHCHASMAGGFRFLRRGRNSVTRKPRMCLDLSNVIYLPDGSDALAGAARS